MKSMRREIKNVVFVISSLTSDGAERVMVELANDFTSRGIQVKIILLSRDDVAYQVHPDVELIFLCNQLKGENRLFTAFERFFLLRSHLKTLKADIVISFISIVNIYACWAARFAGKKLIVSERNDPATVFNSAVMERIRNLSYRMADGHVFQTEDARAYFKGRIFRDSTVIPNPIIDRLPEPYQGMRKKTIVACGRLTSQKNYTLLLEAFAGLDERFREYTLDIYGKGELLDELKAYSERVGVGDRVHFCGVRSDWHELARDASLYVMSSDYEGIPNALLEAIACGIPSVSTDCPCGGPRMLIQDGENGFLVPTGDAEKLRITMEKVMGDLEQSGKVSANGVLIREKYSMEEISGQWLAYIQKVIR